MAETESSNEYTRLRKTPLVAVAMEACAALVVLGTIAAVLVELFVGREVLPGARDFAAAGIDLLLAFVAGALLWGLSTAARKLDEIHQALCGVAETQSTRAAVEGLNRPLSGIPVRVSGEASSAEMVALLREVRDISLLDEKQRALRLETQGNELSRQLATEVPTLLREHNWVEARRRIVQARERFPGRTDWVELEQQVERARSEVESRDVGAATRQINDLASLGAWDRADQVAGELLERHPESKKAVELVAWVRNERTRVETEERRRLMARAQDATNRREWTEALSLANLMIQKFPNSLEAEALRGQLPTLQTNAEIIVRQRQEAQFKLLLEQHRYADALHVARDLVQRFPDSPQAKALQPQIPKLEERVSGSQPTRG